MLIVISINILSRSQKKGKYFSQIFSISKTHFSSRTDAQQDTTTHNCSPIIVECHRLCWMLKNSSEGSRVIVSISPLLWDIETANRCNGYKYVFFFRWVHIMSERHEMCLKKKSEVVNKNCHHYLNVYWKKCWYCSTVLWVCVECGVDEELPERKVEIWN